MIDLTCGSCGHDWTYTGGLTDYTSCPRCSASVKIPESPDGGSRTKRPDDRVTKLEERIDALERKVDELRRRQRRDINDRSSGADRVEETTGEDEGNDVYDPTSAFQNPGPTTAVDTHNALNVVYLNNS